MFSSCWLIGVLQYFSEQCREFWVADIEMSVKILFLDDADGIFRSPDSDSDSELKLNAWLFLCMRKLSVYSHVGNRIYTPQFYTKTINYSRRILNIPANHMIKI